MGGCFPDADLRGVRGTSRIWIPDTDAVDKLQSLCKQAVQKQLRPDTACELLQLADRCQNADLRLQALEKILIHPKEALRLRPAISPRLLDEVLSSPFLCVEQEELFGLLQGWGKRKASALDDDLQPVIDNHTVVVVGKSGDRDQEHEQAARCREESRECADGEGMDLMDAAAPLRLHHGHRVSVRCSCPSFVRYPVFFRWPELACAFQYRPPRGHSSEPLGSADRATSPAGEVVQTPGPRGSLRE
eukprot:s2951_g4.t2